MNIFLYWLEVLVWRDLSRISWFLSGNWGVLAALSSPPFEPAEEVDLRFLYYKCCFLLALASGRRRSEIHAFSVSDSCLRLNRNKSSVTLLTDPRFLGKNQIPDRVAEPVIIPALPEDASSRLSCSIRILSIYLDRTKNYRPAKNTRLFLPLKKGIFDISTKTISSWISRTILLAYESSGGKFLNRHSVKAHEVCALFLPGHFLIQPLFQRFCRLGFGDVRILLFPFILGLCLHKQTIFLHLDL